MTRYLLIFLQGASLALGGLFITVLSIAPFTEAGLLTAPGRAGAGLVILRLMPVEGAGFLPMLPNLLWVPCCTALLALPQGIGLLRHFRWIGFALNLAALGYIYHTFPGLGAPRSMPVPLVATAALFLVNTVLFAMLPQKNVSQGSGTSFAVFLALLLWFGALGLLTYGAGINNLSFTALGGVVGSAMALTIAFYCLVKAIQAPASGRGNALGAAGLLLISLLIGLGFFFVGAVPLAWPVGAGAVLFFATIMR